MRFNLETKDDAVGTLKMTRNVASAGGALTGVTVIWSMIYYSIAGAGLPGWFAGIAALIGVVVGLFIIDYAYRKNLPYGLDLIVSGQAFRDWRIGIFTLLLMAFCFAQMFSSAVLSWEGRKDVVEAVVARPDIEDVSDVKTRADRETRAKVRDVKAEIASLDRKISDKEKEVRAMYPGFVEKIKSGQDKWGWHAKELQKRIDNATKNLSEERANLSANLSKLVGAGATTDSLIVASVVAQNEWKLSEFTGKKERNMRFLGFFGVGCLGVVFITTLMLSLIGYSDINEIDMRQTRQPFRQVAKPAAAPAPDATLAGPRHTIPVRSAGAADSYQLQRQMQQQQARIDEMNRQLEAERRQKEEERQRREAEARRQEQERRQVEERNRQLEADRLAAEQRKEQEAKASRQKQPTKKATNPLSDKESGILSEADQVNLSEAGVTVGNKLYTFDKLSDFIDAATKWYIRQFPKTKSHTEGSARPNTQAKNAAKWKEAEKVLRELGVKITKNGKSVSIDTSSVKITV